MAGCFAFKGHAVMGAYVRRRLELIGWRSADDLACCDVAFTYCVGAGMLEDAYFDEDGLVKNAPAGTLLVDLSPSTPSLAREISAVAAVNDLVFVEAPLAVRDPFGELQFACFAACDEPGGLARARDLLDAIAVSVDEAGPVGSAQLAKAVDTVSKTAALVGSIEARALARAARESVRTGGDSLDDFSEGFPIELLMADVAAAMTAADDVDLILPQLEAAMHLLELLAVIGGAELGSSALSLLYREEAASAACGLDWSRAAGLYADAGHDHAHGFGFDEFYEDDGFGSAGGFGGYSAN